jgi:hypothetical protein
MKDNKKINIHRDLLPFYIGTVIFVIIAVSVMLGIKNYMNEQTSNQYVSSPYEKASQEEKDNIDYILKTMRSTCLTAVFKNITDCDSYIVWLSENHPEITQEFLAKPGYNTRLILITKHFTEYMGS